jgi:hypothetical protein
VSQRSPAQWSATQSAGDAWPAPTVGRGHRTVRCAPDCPVCTGLSGAPTGSALQRSSPLEKERDPHRTVYSDCPVHHPTEGNFGLPCWPPTAPSCLGAIKRTPRRMEETLKHLIYILRLLDSNFAHSILQDSDLSSI